MIATRLLPGMPARIRAAILPRVRPAHVIRLGARCVYLSEFVDGEIDDARGCSFRDHLAFCARCRADTLAFLELTTRLAALPPAPTQLPLPTQPLPTSDAMEAATAWIAEMRAARGGSR